MQEEILNSVLLVRSLRRPRVEMLRGCLELWRADLDWKEELAVLTERWPLELRNVCDDPGEKQKGLRTGSRAPLH